MIVTENQCVDCGLPCLGVSCPHLNVPVRYCDECETDSPCYHIDGIDLCKHCAEKYMQNVFDDLTIEEKAKAFKIPITILR